MGFRRPLKINDIWLINPDRSVDVHVDQVDSAFKKGVEAGYKAPLFWALYGTFKAEFLLGGLCRFISDLFVVGSPYTLRYLIQFAIDSYIAKIEGVATPPVTHGYGLVIGIVFMQIVQSFCTNHFFYNGQMVGGQTRAVLITAIFNKSMKISGRAKNGIKPPSFNATQETLVGNDDGPCQEKREPMQDSNQAENAKSKKKQTQKKKQKTPAAAAEPGWSNGRVIGLMAIDAARIDAAVGLLHTIWTAPIIIVIALALLIVNLSYSALTGLGCLILVMAFLTKTVGGLYTKRKAINQITDKRVGLTQEVLSAIRLVKYFGWESSFVERIVGIRTKETNALQFFMAFRNIVTAASQTLPIFAAMLSFITYATSHNGLSPAVVFSSVALFNSLRMPLTYLPVCIGQAIDAWASLRRIQEYLLEEEQEVYEVKPEMDTAIRVEQAGFTWEKHGSNSPAATLQNNNNGVSDTTLADDTPFSLEDVNFDINRGELVAIIGGVGSGKTSMLSALTGDMRKTHGSVTWGGSKAVCAQYAWMQNATVKQNIVFGCELDEEWYRIVVNACSLITDFESLPKGDATEIGERGINLSGGQKQRISLARAVYSKADILLLDDPLSAVDPYVGKHIFETAICGLLGNKTRVLATHQMHLLNQCDRIIWMDGGRIRAVDSYHSLMLHNKSFATMVHEKVAAAQQSSEATADSAIPDTAVNSVQGATQAKAAEAAKAAAGKMKDLMSAEDQNTKSIPWSVYISYITSSEKMILVALIIPLLCLAQGLNILSSLWLSWWSEDKYSLPQNTYIGIYVMLCVTQAIFLYLFGVCLAISCTSSSNHMLNRAIRRILHAPIAFFDTTPLGRITNRFSKDVDVMDYSLTEALRLYFISIAMVISIFALILSYFYWVSLTTLDTGAFRVCPANEHFTDSMDSLFVLLSPS